MQTCLILIYYSTFRPPSSITHGELTDSCSYTRRISCTPHTQGQSQNHILPSTAFLHSRTHSSQPKTFLITLQIIYMPRAQALFWESSTFQTFQSQPILSLSLSRSLQQNDHTKATMRSGKSGIWPSSLHYRSHTLAISITTLLF
jgi:hypothetical protein